MPPLALISSTASWQPISSFLPRRGVGAGQRIVETDLDDVRGAGRDDEWTGDFRRAERESGFDERAAIDALRRYVRHANSSHFLRGDFEPGLLCRDGFIGAAPRAVKLQLASITAT